MNIKLAHVCYLVTDLDRSERFYCDCLGYRHAFDFNDADGNRFGTYLKNGDGHFIELFKTDAIRREKKSAYQHICYEVDDLAGFCRYLNDKGIETSQVELGSDNSFQSWITDPDGNRIELMEYTPGSKQRQLSAKP